VNKYRVVSDERTFEIEANKYMVTVDGALVFYESEEGQIVATFASGMWGCVTKEKSPVEKLTKKLEDPSYSNCYGYNKLYGSCPMKSPVTIEDVKFIVNRMLADFSYEMMKKK
jgi:hypothetical protein